MSKISKTYKWNWVNEEGHYAGWNWTSAFSIAEARKIARKMQAPARDFTYDILVDGKVEQTIGRNKGMLLENNSVKRVSNEAFMRTWNSSYQD
jgi:hypothetical protein